MLVIPENAGKTAKIIGLDPGSHFLGVAIIEYDLSSMKIVRSSATTYQADKLENKHKWIVNLHGDRIARIQAHKLNLMGLFKEHGPVKIYCESPFYNPRRPNAYGALVEVLSAIRSAVLEWSQWVGLDLVDPPSVKKAVGATAGAKKEQVLEAVEKMASELQLIQDTKVLDEHSIDALAVAYFGYKGLLK